MSNLWQVSAYADGEITARIEHNSSVIQGRQKGQKAQPLGVSRKGRNNIRRATNGHLALTRDLQPIFLTLTTKRKIVDSVFKRHAANWIKRGRKLDSMFNDYIVSYELHQSGQMHAHVLMFEEMPYEVFIAQRELWADYYDNGAYSLDIKPVLETTQAAAGYLAKLPRYMAKDTDETPRPINGRTYTISQSLQPYTKPVTAPISVSGDSQALSRLSDYATLTDDYYMRLHTDSVDSAVDLLHHCGVPISLRDWC